MNVREVLPRDAIPSIDDPTFASTTFCDGTDRVIVLDDDPPRAYPIRILHYHEIVNDRGSHGPVTVTWCPLCGSAVAYDGALDGRELTFGVSGKLADDDLVMYDHQTESEWKQSTGRAIAGPLAGNQLKALPAPILSLETFREAYPDGVVLQAPGGESEAGQRGGEAARIRYDADPYEAYFTGEGFGLAAHRGTGSGDRDWQREDLRPKDPVIGVTMPDEAVGVPLTELHAAGDILHLTVGAQPVVLFGRDDGATAFRNPGIHFEWTSSERVMGDGTTWNPVTGDGEDGRTLSPVPTRRLFAFAWQDDHGPDSFYD